MKAASDGLTSEILTSDKIKCKQATEKVPFLFLEIEMHKLR